MNYFLKLFSTGAVRETPGKVIKAMLAETGNKPVGTIVEIGAGRGELTGALLAHLTSFRAYHALDIDEEACEHLRENFPQIIVHKSSAFDFTNILSGNEKAGLFLSSIPLSFYSKEGVQELLNSAKKNLQPGGRIIIIFSAVWLIPLLKRELPGSVVSGFFTFPPYFMAVYRS